MHNRFTLYLLFLFFTKTLGLFGQKKVDIDNEMLYLQESNFTQLNKPYYYSGERVYFNTFMLYADNKLKDTLSAVLYIELINPEKQIIKSLILKIVNSQSIGDFKLGDNLTPGIYFIRLYTKWNLNYGNNNIQYVPVRVYNKNEKPIPIPLETKRCDYLHAIPDSLSANNSRSFNIVIPNLEKYSINMIDINSVEHFTEKYDSKIVNKFADNEKIFLKYSLERGLVATGAFATKRKKKIQISVFRKSNSEISTFETDEKGSFAYLWDGDTVVDDLVINIADKWQTLLIDTNRIIPPIVFPSIEIIQTQLGNNNLFTKDTLEKDTILLNEIVVKEKKIESKFERILRPYG